MLRRTILQVLSTIPFLSLPKLKENCNAWPRKLYYAYTHDDTIFIYLNRDDDDEKFIYTKYNKQRLNIKSIKYIDELHNNEQWLKYVDIFEVNNQFQATVKMDKKQWIKNLRIQEQVTPFIDAWRDNKISYETMDTKLISLGFTY